MPGLGSTVRRCAVRWRPLLSVVIVTHLVTRVLANRVPQAPGVVLPGNLDANYRQRGR